MSVIRSTWAATAPAEDGTLPASAWSTAATLTIPGGTLLAQNDSTNLYIALDVTAETTNDSGDYFWFVVDINNNGVVDANRDKLFSNWPGDPNRLGMWLMAGPDSTYGASYSEVIPSTLACGFGPSLNSAADHRIWEISFALSDLNITIDPSGPPPVVSYGLQIAYGAFAGDTPADPISDFADFNQITLSVAPTVTPLPASLGELIGSVGIIGTALIGDDGYVTITQPYYVQPDESAFCGTLNFIWNNAALGPLWAAGVTKYQVLHRTGVTAADVGAAAWEQIRQSWANFQIVGDTDVWQSFGPDVDNMYPLVDPSLGYTIQDLLFQWTTSSEPDGLHQFQVNLFDASNNPIAGPAQTVTLKLDNQLPDVKLRDILHGGAPVSPCAMINLTSLTDGVQIQFDAFDAEGDLYSMQLTAEYGAGVSTVVYSDGYSAHEDPAHFWQGVQDATEPSPGVWVPPYTCAYLFQIEATKRTTDGYSFPITYATDFETVTIIKPGLTFFPKPIKGPTHAAPTGFEKFETARTPVKKLAK